MTPHAFVAMPFGTKSGADGAPVDFNRIYAELFEPALRAAGYDVFRADQEQRAGDIRFDMFQELLVADLVVADLTLDNPNVWYELGVRHALRARGVLLVQGPRPSQPFDLYTDRKLVYHLKDGAPDPDHLKDDCDSLARMARATQGAWPGRGTSPVYQLLPELREPDWRKLMLAESNEFSDAQRRWAGRLEVARQKGRPGDILVLADETPSRALWLEAKCSAGDALLDLERFEFALEQYEAVLQVEPKHKRSAQSKAICLGRLGRYEDAREWVRQLTEDHPHDAECWALAGRVEKDQWAMRWRSSAAELAAPATPTPAQMREAAAAEDASLADAIEAYRNAFTSDPKLHTAGVAALALAVMRQHLGGDAEPGLIEQLHGGAVWACVTAQKRNAADYWARAGLAEVMLLVAASHDVVARKFMFAVAGANQDWFALDSTRQKLALLRDLDFRPDETAAALQIVDREIARAAQPFEPRQVLLFAGHRVDAPDRAQPRFPMTLVPAAAAAIGPALDALEAGPGDLALVKAAAGGDLLFAEACAARGVRVQMMLPLPEPDFIEQSILSSDAGADWQTRYYALREQLPKDPPHVMPDELGPLPAGTNAFERCNLWLLYTALARGVDKVRFLCLWDGGGGDGPGGTAHMFREVKRRTGRVTWIDTRKLGARTDGP
ncbi:MAG: tetratricopeptide repeat protein [Proteobacteria bacterium]|nr:tetratricopeptide repeat protein [Pseudomonadota bacterium]